MEYIDVIWKHSHKDEPIRLISELGTDRFELRKLQFFRDGTVEFADVNRETPRTGLGLVAIPSLDEINADDEFEATILSETEFEAMWLACAQRKAH